MGFFARLFGTDPSAKLDKARRLLDRGEYNEARWAIDGLEGDEAESLRQQAHAGLRQLNLDEALARMRLGDRAVGEELLALAQEFGASAAELQAVRGTVRREQAEEKARIAEAEAAKAKAEMGDDPLWSLPADDPRLAYALALEAWPEALRARLVALGGAYAQAVMLLESGKASEALPQLLAFAEREPAASWDSARAAMAAGQLPLAASQLRRFGAEVGHQRIGNTETAVIEAQVLARTGAGDEALTLLDAAVHSGASLAVRGARASLLEALDRPAEAAREAEALITVAPKDQGLYRLLARAREAQGDRGGAVLALEGGLACTCGSPGSCGNQAFDIEAGRTLARIYLEDRAEPARVHELLAEVGKAGAPPTWDDHYITALIARNNASTELPSMAQALLKALRPGDPRAAWVRTHLLPSADSSGLHL